MLFETDIREIIADNLSHIPEQGSLSENDFGALVFDLINTDNTRIIKNSYEQIIRTPIRKWQELFKQLQYDQALAVKGDESINFWIKGLSKNFGPIVKDPWEGIINGQETNLRTLFMQAQKTPTNL
jgi:hypothetical protein